MSRAAARCRAPVARGRAAFTLIEVTMSTMVVGLMLVAALGALGATARVRHVQSVRQRGETLARSLLSEIMAAAYEDPELPGGMGLEAGEASATRQDWDDVDDYHGWNEAPPRDRAGASLAGYEGWTLAATVEHVRADDPAVVASAPQGLKRITVTVSEPGGRPLAQVGLRAKCGLAEQPPERAVTYVSWVGVDVRLGPGETSRLNAGSTLLNQAPGSRNLLVNGDLEAGPAGWQPFGTAALLVESGTVHEGAAALRVAGRIAPASGPGQDVTARLRNGVTYEARAWVRTSAPIGDNVRFFLFRRGSQSGAASAAFGSRWVWSGAWTELIGTVTPTWSGALEEAHLRLETGATTADLLVDGASLREVAP
jgi:type II secretory pathway pseudopilin PulG